MQRRDLLKLIGLSVVVVIGTEPIMVVAEALAPSRHWVYLKLTDFKPSQDFPVLSRYLLGQRSDGNWYYIHMPLSAEQAAIPQIRQFEEENARRTLDTFLDCDCREGVECDLHKKMFAFAEEPDDASVHPE